MKKASIAKRQSHLEKLEDTYGSNQLKQAMKKDKLIGVKATAEWLEKIQSKLK